MCMRNDRRSFSQTSLCKSRPRDVVCVVCQFLCMAAGSSSSGGGFVPPGCIDALGSFVVPPPLEQLRINKPADESWQDRLRRAHRGELDVVTLPVYRFEGKQYALSVPNLERAYVRRQMHMEGYKSAL